MTAARTKRNGKARKLRLDSHVLMQLPYPVRYRLLELDNWADEPATFIKSAHRLIVEYGLPVESVLMHLIGMYPIFGEMDEGNARLRRRFRLAAFLWRKGKYLRLTDDLARPVSRLCRDLQTPWSDCYIDFGAAGTVLQRDDGRRARLEGMFISNLSASLERERPPAMKALPEEWQALIFTPCNSLPPGFGSEEPYRVVELAFVATPLLNNFSDRAQSFLISESTLRIAKEDEDQPLIQQRLRSQDGQDQAYRRMGIPDIISKAMAGQHFDVLYEQAMAAMRCVRDAGGLDIVFETIKIPGLGEADPVCTFQQATIGLPH